MSSYKHPKLFIIGYFDDLIRDVEIEAEEILQKYTENDLLRAIFHNHEDELHENPPIRIEPCPQQYNSSYAKDVQVDLEKYIPGQTRVIDYINEIRLEMIGLLRKEQETLLRYFDANRSLLKYVRNEMSEDQLEELKAQLFANRFIFFIQINPINSIFQKLLITSDTYFKKDEIKRIG